MYGKYFASTFTGSMFGSGPTVFAVWGYVIANTVDARVELNPLLLAAALGSTPEAVQTAIDKLCQPDPASRNPDAEGRRLQREGQYQYRVTSHEIYRAIRNEEDRRAYNRVKQRESRARRKNKSTTEVIDGQSLSALSAHTEADLEADLEARSLNSKNKLASSSRVSTTSEKPNGGNGKPHASSKHPIFKGERIVIFDWMLEDMRSVLGPQNLDAFNIDQWFYDLDKQVTLSGNVIPKSEQWAYVQRALLAEAALRGLPIEAPAAFGTTKKTAGNAAALQRFAERP